jgi:NADPH:quinone reductase
MLQGMTAHYLACTTFPLNESHTCLIHAAAGGVGLLLTRIARNRGATVIGTVSTREKEELCREAGAEHVIRYTEQNFVEEVKSITDGRGVDVVYDSVGRTTFDGSLQCLRRRGMLVSFGQSSGAIDPLELARLSKAGSIYLTRPTLFDYTATREELMQRATDVFTWIASSKLGVRIHAEYAFERVRDAHTALAGRQTSGKILLTMNH